MRMGKEKYIKDGEELPYWKKGPGRPKDFETPEEMLSEIVAAFERMSKPLYEVKAFHKDGVIYL